MILEKIKKELEELEVLSSGKSDNTSKGLRLAIDIIDREIKEGTEAKQISENTMYMYDFMQDKW